ncbi:MAG: hypothetical protein JRM73_00485 [Nitrososphaerota archaeon]|nr:hypothetical protein [Nitrososphaerota archaeon]
MALATAGFSLGIRPLSSLLPHEEVIPRHVQQVAAEMARDKIQRDPIIIERESAVVLDGMHRLAAFRELKIENAVCCSVEYSSTSVSLGRWARVYGMKEGDRVTDALAEVGGTKRANLAEAFSALDRRDASFAVLTPDAAFLSDGKQGHEHIVSSVAALDRMAERRGWERGFVSEDEVDVPLQDPRKVVVLLRRLTKEDVVSAARSGRLFPCKTSMHAIDPRPVAVDFPIAELNDADTAKLKRWLGGNEGKILPRGSSYGGRRYKERLLVLSKD